MLLELLALSTPAVYRWTPYPTELALSNIRCFAREGCFPKRFCSANAAWPPHPASALKVDLGFEKRLFCTDAAVLRSSARSQPPCLVYSFGIHDQYAWEAEMAREFSCEVHAFDPTQNYPSALAPGVTFHKLGLKSGTSQDGTNGEGYSPIDPKLLLTLVEVQQRLNHINRPIAVLMLDCEGCEWGVIKELACPGHSGNVVVNQLVAEFHFQASLGLDGTDSVLSAGETLSCLEKDWAMTSWQRAGAGPMDWNFAPGVLNAIARPDTLVVASFRILTSVDRAIDVARAQYAQAVYKTSSMTKKGATLTVSVLFLCDRMTEYYTILMIF